MTEHTCHQVERLKALIRTIFLYHKEVTRQGTEMFSATLEPPFCQRRYVLQTNQKYDSRHRFGHEVECMNCAIHLGDDKLLLHSPFRNGYRISINQVPIMAHEDTFVVPTVEQLVTRILSLTISELQQWLKDNSPTEKPAFTPELEAALTRLSH